MKRKKKIKKNRSLADLRAWRRFLALLRRYNRERKSIERAQ